MRLPSRCPICGAKLVVVEYLGNNPEILATMKVRGFCGFLGCIRVDLHDKVVGGVNCRGRVFRYPVVHGDGSG